MRNDLPSELWTQIFDLAADEDLLFQPALPTTFGESVWWKDYAGEWKLRSPHQAMHILQYSSYATKKAIILTCKKWQMLGAEFLFRCLWFNDPIRLINLHNILTSSSSTATTISSSLGWWTRRIHISQYHPSPLRGVTKEDLDDALVSIIRYCPNLEIFIVERAMGNIFGPVADTIASYAVRNLRVINWNIPGESLAKVIWALNLLPDVVALHIDIETPTPSSQECAHLGSAADMNLSLPHLQQLSVRGYIEEFIEQVMGWHLPSLCSFSLATGNSVSDVPDVVNFLQQHGVNLLYLDLDSAFALDVPRILDLCPNLRTFAFNADWDIKADFSRQTSILTNRTHMNISSIGLHGLSDAFRMGTITLGHGFVARIRRLNDLNVSALNRNNFPRLMSVRALNRSMLVDLNADNGPSQDDGGYERWSKWWDTFSQLGIRLEDCTGQPLGTLPHEDDSEEESEEDGEGEEDSSEEADSDDGPNPEVEVDPEYQKFWENWQSPTISGSNRTPELTLLRQEVQAHNAERDEKLIERFSRMEMLKAQRAAQS